MGLMPPPKRQVPKHGCLPPSRRIQAPDSAPGNCWCEHETPKKKNMPINTLQGINISHLGKRENHRLKSALSKGIC